MGELKCARQMARSSSPGSTLVYVSSYDGFCTTASDGSIYVVELSAESGAVSRTATLVRGLRDPQGIDVAAGTLYVATGGQASSLRGNCVLKISSVDAAAADVLDGAPALSAQDSRIEDVACGFTKTQSQHHWRSLRMSPSGTHAVVSIGADCNWDR